MLELQLMSEDSTPGKNVPHLRGLLGGAKVAAEREGGKRERERDQELFLIYIYIYMGNDVA